MKYFLNFQKFLYYIVIKFIKILIPPIEFGAALKGQHLL